MTALGLPGQKLTLKFIELYKAEPALWNRQDSGYRCSVKRLHAWKRIQARLKIDCSLEDVKAKRDCVMSIYRQNVRKIKDAAAKGEHFKPTWFAFGEMDSFLNQRYSNEDYRCIDSEKDPIDDNKTKIEEVAVAGDPGEDEEMIEYLIEDEGLLAAEIFPKIDKQEQQLTSKNIRLLSKKRPLSKMITSSIKNKRHDLYAKSKTKYLDEADECELYGRLLVKKLKRLSEKDRDLVMMEIDNILFRTKMRLEAKGEIHTS